MADLNLPEILTYLLVLVASLTVHEWGHAASAYWLGDDTAARQGRMTFNPAVHVDPVGTLLVPVLRLLGTQAGVTVPLFGWAKPVPVNSSRFKRSITLRAGEALTAVAGPSMNLVLALLATVALVVVAGLRPEWLCSAEGQLSCRDGFSWWAWWLVGEARTPLCLGLAGLLTINLALAFFNLIPVPPLDGGWILQWVLPQQLQWLVEWLGRRGLIILLIAVFGPGFLSSLVPHGVSSLLPWFFYRSDVVRVLAGAICGVAALRSLQAVRSARRAGHAGRTAGQESVLEWTLPLAVAFGMAQVGVLLTRLSMRALLELVGWGSNLLGGTAGWPGSA